MAKITAWVNAVDRSHRAPVSEGRALFEVDRMRPAIDPAALPVRLGWVARDWRSAYALSGQSLVPTDTVRATSSSRMVLVRVESGFGALTPFFQMGGGQWRYDRGNVPYLPINNEGAGEVAAGGRLRITSWAEVSAEGAYTLLIRETREPQNLPTPRVLMGLLAVSCTF